MGIIKASNGVELEQNGRNVHLYSVPATLSGHWDVPDTVTHLQLDQFGPLPGITSITIPEKTTYISYQSFRNCSNLEKIIVSPDNPYYSSDPPAYCSTKTNPCSLRHR